jgi:predicted transposase YbfD/YdcC
MPKIEGQQIHGVVDAFKSLPEYRKNLLNIDHKLHDIIAVAVMAVIAGADGPTDIFDWADMHKDDLVKIMKLEHGIPSRDTIRRTLQAIDPNAFQKCFLGWIGAFRDKNSNKKEAVAIDGKTLRRSHDGKNDLGALHIVSAYSTEHGISLSQLATEEKSNEITAIPVLLDSLVLDDAVVTLDAMGTQTKIVDKIVSKNAGYVIGVKENQKKLYKAIDSLFRTTNLEGRNVSRVVEDETSHGRQEHREYYQMTVPDDFSELQRWTGLRTVGMTVRTHVDKNGKSKTEIRYFISSERRNGKQFANYVRGHWGIENSLHWVMDVTFREDDSRIRERTLADNISWIRRFAITLYKQHPSKKSMARQRKMAAWNLAFLMELILGNQEEPIFQVK